MNIPSAIFSLGFYLPLGGFLESSEVSPESPKADLSIESELGDVAQSDLDVELSCENSSL